jgi:hypothetical protein
MVDQRVCGSVCGGVEMTEEDSTAVEGAGSALLGMGTSADWTKEDVGVHSNVLGDAGDVAGYLDSRNHEVTCSKRVFGLALGVVAMREVSSSCRDVGHRKLVRVVGWVLMIAMVSAGGGLKVVRVLLVLGGGVASLVLVGGVGWFMVVVVVREEWKR